MRKSGKANMLKMGLRLMISAFQFFSFSAFSFLRPKSRNSTQEQRLRFLPLKHG